MRGIRRNRTIVTLLLLLSAMRGYAAEQKMTGAQCEEELGEPVSGTAPLSCPDGQHLLGRITDAHCSCICCTPAGAAKEVRIKYGLPIIETRNGKRSVWGISLQLSTPLKQPVTPETISIVESKHSRELRRLMDLRLKQHGQQLDVMFKPGKGDFGSGNTVHISIRIGVLLANGNKSTRETAIDVKTDLLQ